MTGKLSAHLREIDKTASERMEQLTQSFMETEGVTEALKAQDQMAWVQVMNNIRNRAEEIILHELVYA